MFEVCNGNGDIEKQELRYCKMYERQNATSQSYQTHIHSSKQHFELARRHHFSKKAQLLQFRDCK